MTHIGVFSSRMIAGNPKEWGGVHTHLKNLVSVIAQNGYDATLFTRCKEKSEDGQLAMIPIHGWREGKENTRLIQRAQAVFWARHIEKPVDCIFSEGIAARCLKSLANSLDIPLVSFVHNLHMHYFYNNLREVEGLRALKSYIFRSVPRYLYGMFAIDIPFLKTCRKIVTGNTAIAGHINRFYRIPVERIVTIHNWVDTNAFDNHGLSETMSRKSLGIPASKIIFLAVGFLWRPKGFHVLLKSFHNLAGNSPDAFLVIAGDGPEKKRLSSFIQHHPELKTNVRLIGQCPHDKIRQLYALADIFVIPSLFNEVLPYTLLEAMSCGLPVIASDIPANREALGSSGHFVKTGDVEALRESMARFMSELPKRKIDAGRYRERIVRLFSHEAASKKIARLLREVLGSE